MVRRYVFQRHKKTGRKSIVDTVDSEQEAIEICAMENRNPNNHYWYEFTKEFEYTR